MKKIILALVAVIVVFGAISFTFFNTKEDKLNGTFQVFVNSFKKIESTSTPSMLSYKDRKNDSLIEGFQMYTFDFDSNFVIHDFLLSNEKGEITSHQVKSHITKIETDGNMAYIVLDDKSKYYSDTKEKIFILNLNRNKRYPILSAFWKNNGKTSGAYSIDNNDFNGLYHESNPEFIFNDEK